MNNIYSVHCGLCGSPTLPDGTCPNSRCGFYDYARSCDPGCDPKWNPPHTYDVSKGPIIYGNSIIESDAGGKRQAIGRRYDLLFEEFGEALDAWSEIAHYGEQKHGNKNWHKLDFDSEQSPLNHAIGHLRKAMSAEPGEYRRRQLAKVIWNIAAQMWKDAQASKRKPQV